VLEDLKDEKFQIKKDEDKYTLNILIKVLNKEKSLMIEITQSEDDLIKFLIKSVKSQEERITDLENEIKNLKQSSTIVNIKVEDDDQTDRYLELDSFNITELIENPKLLYDFESLNQIATIVVLKNGRNAIGQEIGSMFKVMTHPTGISIFDPSTYKEIFFIEKLGGDFIELKNVNLLIKDYPKTIHIIKLNTNFFDLLQTIQLESKIYRQMTKISDKYFSISLKVMLIKY